MLSHCTDPFMPAKGGWVCQTQPVSNFFFLKMSRKAFSSQLVQRKINSRRCWSTRNFCLILFHRCGIQRSYSGLLGTVTCRQASPLPAVAIPFVIILERDHVANPTSINSLGEGILRHHCLHCLPFAVPPPLESLCLPLSQASAGLTKASL